MHQPQTGLALSESRLRVQQLAFENEPVDNEFVKRQIKEEGTQDFERALADYPGGDAYVRQQSRADALQTIVQLYGHPPNSPSSTASPMFRLCSIGRTNESIPLLAQQANESAGVASGSLELIELRSSAADVAAEELEVDFNSTEEETAASISNFKYSTTHQGSKGDLARVRRKVQRRRKTSVVQAVEPKRSD